MGDVSAFQIEMRGVASRLAKIQEAPGSVRFGSVLARTVPVPPVPVLVPVPPVPVPTGSGSKPVPVHSKCRIWVRLNRTEVLVPPPEPHERALAQGKGPRGPGINRFRETCKTVVFFAIVLTCF